MVEIIDETDAMTPDDVALLSAALSALAAYVHETDDSVTLVIVDDAEMHRRNLRDRGVDDVTDVLSYPTHEPDDVGMPHVGHLGDLFVCLPQAERQARMHGVGTLDEVATLGAHGFMHLLGHDHPDEASWGPFLDAQRWIVGWLSDARAAVS